MAPDLVPLQVHFRLALPLVPCHRALYLPPASNPGRPGFYPPVRLPGTVTDSSGAPVAGAASRGEEFGAPSAEGHPIGRRRQLFVGPASSGAYEVIVTMPGFRTFNETGIIITAKFLATIHSRLQVGEVAEVVKVEGNPIIDLENNQTSTTFDQNLLQDIPSGRDPWSTVAQMPRVPPPAPLTWLATIATNSPPWKCMAAPRRSRFHSFNGLDLNWPGSNGGYTQFLYQPRLLR